MNLTRRYVGSRGGRMPWRTFLAGLWETQFPDLSQGFHECQVKVEAIEVGLEGFNRLSMRPVLRKVRQIA